MKLKNIIWAGAGIILLALVSCVKDDGNYVYKELEEVTPGEVSGMEEFYNLQSLQRLQITPEVERITNDEEYEYFWCVWKTAYDRSSWKDTISREKNLDYVVNLTSGTYELSFQAVNKKTGVSVYQIVPATVASVFAEGWFVTKSEEGMTDLYLVKKDGTTYPDILKTANGQGVPGEGIKCVYQSGYYTHQQENEDGTVTVLSNQKVFYVLSNTGLGIYNADDMHLFKDFDEAFIDPPAVKNVQNIFIGMTGQFLFNDGKISWIESFRGNLGKFGFPVLGDYGLSPFKMGSMNQGMLVYDTLSHSFLRAPFGTTKLVELKNEPGQVDCNRMTDYDLVFMDEQTAYFGITKGGIAFLKNKAENEYYATMLNTEWTSGKNPFVNLIKVPADRSIKQAKVFATHCTNDVLYFSDGGNTVGMYNVTNGTEQKAILTYPEGESVAYIRHISYKTYSAGDEMLECLAVLTNSAAGWKVYLYRFVGKTAEIVVPEYQHFSGKGVGKNVMFRGLNAYDVN